MSGESTQGAALCAPAAVASAVSAAAVTSVFIENRLILEFSRQPIRIHANQALLNKSRTAIRRQYDASRSRDFAVSRCKLDRYLRFQSGRDARQRDIKMKHLIAACGIGLLVSVCSSAAFANEFRLSNNQRISCSRGLSPGKLSTATCKSHAYLFNIKTSEY